ncbi:MAG: ferritin family protein, partial [Thermoplasmatota archaeon]
MTEIEDMGLKELLEQGIQSEINSQNVYKAVARESHSYSLSGKLRFLVEEERDHEATLRRLFKENYPDEVPDIPQEVMKPAPDIDME